VKLITSDAAHDVATACPDTRAGTDAARASSTVGDGEHPEVHGELCSYLSWHGACRDFTQAPAEALTIFWRGRRGWMD
jgi:hypothetical protein